MTGVLLNHGDGLIIIRLSDTGDHEGRNNIRCTLCDGAGLIKAYRVDLGCALNCVAALDENTLLCGVADCSDNYGRCSQHQSAGAGDDQNSHDAKQVMCQEPDDHAAKKNDGEEDLRELIRDLLSVALVILCAADGIDDLTKDSIAAELFRLDLNNAVFVQCTNEDLVADGLVDRHGFTGNGSLINGCGTLLDNTIDCDLFTGLNLDDIADTYLLDGYFLELTVNELAALCRNQLDKLCDRVFGLHHGDVLKDFTDDHHECYQCTGKVLFAVDTSDQGKHDQHAGSDLLFLDGCLNSILRTAEAAEQESNQADREGKYSL